MKASKFIFLLFSTLFLFSCANQGLDPNNSGGGGGDETQPDLNIAISYLNEDFSPSDIPTDIIALKYDGMPEGFDMIAKWLPISKEYRVILGTATPQFNMTFFYKLTDNFPYRIITSDDSEEYADGNLSGGYNEKDENFDVVWTMGDDVESFIDVPLKKDIFDYSFDAGGNEIIENKIKLTMISVNIMNAINQYVENTPQTIRF